jgi:N-acylglucosamine 2-epimerase
MNEPTSGAPIFTPARIDQLLATYRDGLLKSTLPFWFPRCVDVDARRLYVLARPGWRAAGQRQGDLAARAGWLAAGDALRDVEPRPEWLYWARHGIDFLRRYGFDDDGRMFFLVDREGRPLRKRRYIFSETFMIAALAAYGRAAGDAAALS